MKKISLKTAVLSLAFMAFGITFSMAQSERKNEQQKPPTFSELLKQMDKNEDGKLAKAEIKGPLKDDFDNIDTDGDGFISEKEFKKAPKPGKTRTTK